MVRTSTKNAAPGGSGGLSAPEAKPRDTTQASLGDACPMLESWRLVSRPWAIAVLREIGVYGRNHFNEILRSNRGLTPRILSRRLSELTKAGLLRREIYTQDSFRLEWRLTPKGEDMLPALASLARFGVRHFGYVVFDDGLPRELPESFPTVQASLETVVRRSPPVRVAQHPAKRGSVSHALSRTHDHGPDGCDACCSDAATLQGAVSA
jgi:DNA-binding HxlR family transcriptional regulator